MRQFRSFKEQYPDCILFFRMGDFYELFYDDAKIAHQVLGLTLTQRTAGIPMAGLPYHAMDGYLRRMIQAGYRVAICDQVEDPKQAKGVVKRDVTRLVTPGTLTDASMLADSDLNQIAGLCFLKPTHAVVAVAELSTGRFRVCHLQGDAIADELARIGPSELLYVQTADRQAPAMVQQLGRQLGCALTGRPAWQFRMAEAAEVLHKQFQVTTLEGFGFKADDPLIQPAGAVVSYLLETQRLEAGRLVHLQPPIRWQQQDYLLIDQVSLRSLEIERTMRSGQTAGSLLGTIQNCRTAMGKRLLRHWLCFPLRDLQIIERRQQAVGAMVHDTTFAEALSQAVDPVQDIERIVGRLSVARGNPRDLVALGRSLTVVDRLIELLDQRPEFAVYSQSLLQVAPHLNELGGLLAEACVDDPPAHLRDGGMIRDGYDPALDEYRSLQSDSNSWLAAYQAELTEQTGIPSLKVGYNKVFGYYIEVTHAHAQKVPVEFTRKQTLKNAERYITEPLKQYEEKVLSASQQAISREQALFDMLCAQATDRLAGLGLFADLVAQLDVLNGFARRAVQCRYVQPQMVEEPVLSIVEGRHPVIDDLLTDQFVANDVALGVARPGGAEDEPVNTVMPDTPATLGLITGPNMAGKSTYIRQAALLCLMAHTGSFIPATEATIGLTDRIFTRVGASDELHAGQSTFMVEMIETANICHHATSQSLVILDEIGRGTSTLDGLSLAWSITEHLAARRCRALFATHYHELTQLAEQFDNIMNLNVAVREWQEEVVFLHRIVPGATDRSYGIHVAKIAGLPRSVIERADAVMKQLDLSTHQLEQVAVAPPASGDQGRQLSLFTEFVEHPAMTRLREVDLNSLTPLDAFDLLRRLRDELAE